MEQTPQYNENGNTYPQSPPQSQQPNPQQPYNPPYLRQYSAPPGPSAFESIVRSSTFHTLIFLGMLFIFIGLLTLSIIPELSYDAHKHAVAVGYIMANLGMFILATFILLASVIRKEMDKYVRVALIILSAILIFLWLTALNLGPMMG